MYDYDFRNKYQDLIRRPALQGARPVIGITGNYEEGKTLLLEGYYKSLIAAGAVPLIFPPTADEQTMLALLDRVDGLLLSGGADVNPLCYGEEPKPDLGSINAERDACELLLVRLAYNRQIPMLGICRGEQLLAIALGGTVYQDMPSECTDVALLKHSQQAPRYTATHFVETLDGSLMHRLFGERFAVNSYHHQAVCEPGERFRVTARSADGIVEAIESTERKSIFGVQWHPETFCLAGDDRFLPLFRHFVHEADCFRRARQFHQSLGIVTLDSHCDTPMFFEKGIRFDTRDSRILVDHHKLREGHLDAVFMVAYLPQGERTPEAHAAATDYAKSILTQIQEMAAHCDGVSIAYTPKDIYQNKLNDEKSIVLGIENGYAIGHDIDNVAYFKDMGVTYITLCHNGDNDICDSARRSDRTHGGLSAFGREVVREMNRLGVMVDLSHASEDTFYQAIEVSEVPVVCSHSSARALCDHPRNLTDDQLRALAECGGVAQVTLYNGFLRSEGQATIDDAVRHLLHMIDVAGIDHVGIGSDFDGDGGVPGCASAAELINFTTRLLAEGLTFYDLEKIWGRNFLRVMRQTQDNALLAQ